MSKDYSNLSEFERSKIDRVKEEKSREIICGIADYSINNANDQMIITLGVFSENPHIDKYKEVYDEIKELLQSKFQDF